MIEEQMLNPVKRWFAVLAPLAHLGRKYAKSRNIRRSPRREYLYVKLWVWAADIKEAYAKCIMKHVRGIMTHHSLQIFDIDGEENELVEQKVKFYNDTGELPESVARGLFFCDYLNLDSECALHYVKDELQYFAEQKLRESKKMSLN